MRIIAIASVAFLLLGCAVLSAVRNSQPEVGSLVVCRAVDSKNKPLEKTTVFDPSTPHIFISGRLAHVPDAELKMEVYMDGKKASGYPVTLKKTGKSYPDNYFSVRIGKPESGWQTGVYMVKVYPKGDSNPIKPQVTFEIACRT